MVIYDDDDDTSAKNILDVLKPARVVIKIIVESGCFFQTLQKSDLF